MFKEKLIKLSVKLTEINKESIDFEEVEENYAYLQQNLFNSQDSIGSKIKFDIERMLSDKEIFLKLISSDAIEDIDLFKNITNFEIRFEKVYDCGHDKFWEICNTIIEKFFEREVEEEGEGKLKNKKLLILQKLNEISNIKFSKEIKSEEILETCIQKREKNNNLLCDKCSFKLNNKFSISIGLGNIELEEINIDNHGNLITSEIIKETIEDSIDKYINYMFFDSIKELQDGGELFNKIDNYLKNKMIELGVLLPDMIKFLNEIKFVADKENLENNLEEFEESLKKIVELVEKSDIIELLKKIINIDISAYDQFKEQYNIYELEEIIFYAKEFNDILSLGTCVNLSIRKFKDKLNYDGKVLLYIDPNTHNDLQYKDIFKRLKEINVKRDVAKIRPKNSQENQNDYTIDKPNVFDPYKMLSIKKNKYKGKLWSFLRSFVNWGYFIGDLEEGEKLFEEGLRSNFSEIWIINRENSNFNLKFIIRKWYNSYKTEEIE